MIEFQKDPQNFKTKYFKESLKKGKKSKNNEILNFEEKKGILNLESIQNTLKIESLTFQINNQQKNENQIGKFDEKNEEIEKKEDLKNQSLENENSNLKNKLSKIEKEKQLLFQIVSEKEEKFHSFVGY